MQFLTNASVLSWSSAQIKRENLTEWTEQKDEILPISSAGGNVASIYELLSTICTPLTHCASSACLFLCSPLTQWLACDASPAPSDCSDQIQAQPDVTSTPACSCVITEDSPTRLEKQGATLDTFSDCFIYFFQVFMKHQMGFLACLCVDAF